MFSLIYPIFVGVKIDTRFPWESLISTWVKTSILDVCAYEGIAKTEVTTKISKIG